MAGPIQKASTADPSAADPTHHHDATPLEYPSAVAFTVEPAPMFAASIVEKIRPGPSCRPATKKSDAPRTRRPIQRPNPMRRAEYESRRASWRVIERIARALFLQIARGRNAGDAGGLRARADDGGGERVR